MLDVSSSPFSSFTTHNNNNALSNPSLSWNIIHNSDITKDDVIHYLPNPHNDDDDDNDFNNNYDQFLDSDTSSDSAYDWVRTALFIIGLFIICIIWCCVKQRAARARVRVIENRILSRPLLLGGGRGRRQRNERMDQVMEATRKEYVMTHLETQTWDETNTNNEDKLRIANADDNEMATPSKSITATTTITTNDTSQKMPPSHDNSNNMTTISQEEKEQLTDIPSTTTATAAISELSAPKEEEAVPSCCSICLEPYQPGEEISFAKGNDKCNHVFHKDCIVEWLMGHDDCPCCRVCYFEEDEDQDGDDDGGGGGIGHDHYDWDDGLV